MSLLLKFSILGDFKTYKNSIPFVHQVIHRMFHRLPHINQIFDDPLDQIPKKLLVKQQVICK